MELPSFRYHPQPLVTGAIVKLNGHCRCCEKQVDHMYVAPTFSIYELDEQLCPWCIADGSANLKFDVEFSDPHPLAITGLPQEKIDEVTTRTPGFVCWQQPTWLTHCNEACAFLGDATNKALDSMTDPERLDFMKTGRLDRDEVEELLSIYRPGADPGIYHFRCLHCHFNRFGIEYS